MLLESILCRSSECCSLSVKPFAGRRSRPEVSVGAVGPVQPRAGGSLFRPESQGRRNVPSAAQACGGKALSALLSEILDIFSWTRQKVTVFVSLKTFCPDSRHLPMPARRHGAPLAVTSVAMSAGMRGWHACWLAGGDGTDGSPGRCY